MGSDIGGDGLRRWLLVTGNRRAVTGFLVVSLYVAMFPLSMFDQAGVNPIFGERSSVAALLNTLLSGVILLVSVVVSIASLFTSQELSPVGRQRERVDSSHEFRHETEAVLDREVSPVRPSAFLRAITQAVLQRAQEIRDSIDGDEYVKPVDENSDGLQARIDEYVDCVADDTERVNQTLGSDDTDTFGMLLAALEYNYAEHLYAIRRLQSHYDDQLHRRDGRTHRRTRGRAQILPHRSGVVQVAVSRTGVLEPDQRPYSRLLADDRGRLVRHLGRRPRGYHRNGVRSLVHPAVCGRGLLARAHAVRRPYGVRAPGGDGRPQHRLL